MNAFASPVGSFVRCPGVFSHALTWFPVLAGFLGLGLPAALPAASPGAINPSLTFSNALPSHAGRYAVVVNPFASLTFRRGGVAFCKLGSIIALGIFFQLT
jgi:hypothetical protein